MHSEDDLERANRPTAVELQVLDPQLRHRIAAAIQRAGLGPLRGGIEIAIRTNAPGGAVGHDGQLVELTAEGMPDEPLLATDPGRAVATIQALVGTPSVTRAAGRLDGNARLQVLCGESSLAAAAVAERAQPSGRTLALEHGARLTAERLQTLLASEDTVFVGDVEQSSSAVQSRLLALIDDPASARRLIVSCSTDPAECAAADTLDRTLAERLGAHVVRLDPPGKRAEELDATVEALLAHYCTQLDRAGVPTLSPEAHSALRTHVWRGGTDELAAAIERAALLSDGRRILPVDLPPSVLGGGAASSPFLPADWATRSLRDVRESAASAAERAFLDAVLRHTRGIIKDAAAMCGIGPRSLYDRMQQHGLRKEDYKR